MNWTAPYCTSAVLFLVKINCSFPTLRPLIFISKPSSNTIWPVLADVHSVCLNVTSFPTWTKKGILRSSGVLGKFTILWIVADVAVPDILINTASHWDIGGETKFKSKIVVDDKILITPVTKLVATCFTHIRLALFAGSFSTR